MKRLVVLANAFPYGTWEPFLSTELEFNDGFDAIHVMSLSVRDDQARTCRDLPAGPFTTDKITFRPSWFYLVKAVRALWDPHLYSELKYLRRRNRLSPRNLVTLFVFLSRSHHEAGEVLRALKEHGTTAEDDILIYSYRLFYQPYLSQLLQRHFPGARLVARAHRADLYEDHSPTKYLPLRQETVDLLGEIHCVAQHGKDHILATTEVDPDKIHVSRLGTIDQGMPGSVPSRRDCLKITSCSTITPVKRVHLLAEALAGTTRRVHWTHFGDGPLRPEIDAIVARFPSNVTVDFKGHVPNHEVIESYLAQPTHIFVNCSSSEGVPVSIMEALSTGTPVVATDVGGTGELVGARNGTLLPGETTPEELRGALEHIANLSDDDYAALRAEARRTWEEHADANALYPSFWRRLASL